MEITIKVNKKQLSEAIINSPDIQSQIADKLYNRFIDGNWNEIKEDFKEEAKDAVTTVVMDYLKSYYSLNNIKNRVEEVIKNMTKKDVIELLKVK